MAKEQITDWDNREAFLGALRESGESATKKSLAPFKWIGGKGKLSEQLLALIPPHDRYIEVFGGALNLLWSKKRSRHETVNDFDGELVNLYKAIKHHPDTLRKELETMWHSRELFYCYKNGMRRPNENAIQRAAITYYLIYTSFAGRRESFGRETRSVRVLGSRLYRDFAVWSQRLRGVQIENLDFERLIVDYDGDDAFFYLDPPYLGSEDCYQVGSGFGEDDHLRLAKTLKNTKGKWLLSYNDAPQIRELYKDYQILEMPEIAYGVSRSPTKKRAREIAIKNY